MPDDPSNLQNSVEQRRWQLAEVIAGLDVRPFVNGKFAAGSVASGEFTTYDPYTQLPLATLPVASIEDVDSAVSAARVAFDDGPWPRMSRKERAEHLRRLATVIDAHAGEIAVLEAGDIGKSYAGVKSWAVSIASGSFRYYADLVAGHQDEVFTTDGLDVVVRSEPVGVVAAVIAWNFPFGCAAWKLAPALAAGCTVVVKAPERAPLSVQYLAALIAEAGLPDGVVNIINGDASTGRALVGDPRVDKVSFTGSTSIGRAIARVSSEHFATTVMELGGKSPFVVCEDVDIPAVAAAASQAMFSVQGQDCAAASRVYVQRSVFGEFIEKLRLAAEQRVLGDPFDDETQQGPQIDRAHVDHIDRFVTDAISHGATAITGARPASDDALFYLPTVFTNVSPDSRLMQEEVFGPVSVVTPFDHIDEAIRQANDTQFGLAAGIWTANERNVSLFTDLTRSGTIWVNCWGEWRLNVPWGGVKSSGHGRELSAHALREFTVTKSVIRPV